MGKQAAALAFIMVLNVSCPSFANANGCRKPELREAISQLEEREQVLSRSIEFQAQLVEELEAAEAQARHRVAIPIITAGATLGLATGGAIALGVGMGALGTGLLTSLYAAFGGAVGGAMFEEENRGLAGTELTFRLSQREPQADSRRDTDELSAKAIQKRLDVFASGHARIEEKYSLKPAAAGAGSELDLLGRRKLGEVETKLKRARAELGLFREEHEFIQRTLDRLEMECG